MSLDWLLTGGLLVAIVLLLLAWLRIRQMSDHLDHTRASLSELGGRFDAQNAQFTQLGESLSGVQPALEKRLGEAQLQQTQALADSRTALTRSLSDLQQAVNSAMEQHQTRFEQRHSESLKALQDTLRSGVADVQKQVNESLDRNTEQLTRQLDKLTSSTDERLKEISGQVEKRLTEGFEKTTSTFADVLKRLALIDEAQKKITELSGNVLSLQEVLADKRSRGAFGEVQLSGLVRNVLPESSFALQYKLPNDRVADCILFLPEPTGNVVIDSKFPLESYRRMSDPAVADTERHAAEKQFKLDVRKHIQDISGKYIIKDVTSDGAMMFIPAEAVFAEIQAHHPDIVELAFKQRVWLCSPTTMMAVLNTARAVLKDAATRKQIHVIQEHLGELGKDFERFRKRMDNLARHINQAHNDVEQVHTSAKKIASRFDKIEQVELEHESPTALAEDHD